jgi:hypothetical protein
MTDRVAVVLANPAERAYTPQKTKPDFTQGGPNRPPFLLEFWLRV